MIANPMLQPLDRRIRCGCGKDLIGAGSVDGSDSRVVSELVSKLALVAAAVSESAMGEFHVVILLFGSSRF